MGGALIMSAAPCASVYYPIDLINSFTFGELVYHFGNCLSLNFDRYPLPPGHTCNLLVHETNKDTKLEFLSLYLLSVSLTITTRFIIIITLRTKSDSD